MKHAPRLSLFTVLSAVLLLAACRGDGAPRSDEAVVPRPGGISHDERMAWWREARFGLFLHWGLYSIPAGEWKGEKDHGEWILTTGQIPVDQYEELASRFDPRAFDAEAWAQMAYDAGMKYVVITSKHHDGFALYDSAVSEYDVMATPFQRDILRELAEAVRKRGLVMCWYHSIMDWHHPDYLPRRDWEARSAEGADFSRYRQYLSSQVRELLTDYGPIGVMWFDGEWEPTWTNEYGKELYELCRRLQPSVIVNNRVSTGRAGMAGMTRGSEFPGDFGTPEQEIPAQGLPGVDWETCMTMNDHWGFNAADDRWKSSEDLIRKLCDIASKGGNFLLNVGPTAEGRFPRGSVERLAAIGAWMRVNAESIHGTEASPLEALPWGRCTMRARPDGSTTLYFHVFDWPSDGVLSIDGLGNRVLGARLLADERKVPHLERDGRLTLRVGRQVPDKVAGVVALDVEGAPVVFRAPRIEAPTPRFLQRTQITLVPSSKELQVHYTLDGREPTAASPEGRGPIEIVRSCTVKARSFLAGQPVGAVASLALEKVAARRALTLAPTTPGLLRERRAGNFQEVAGMAAVPSTESVVVPRVELPEGPREERVAYAFRGAIRVPADDVYVFSLTSDDGARLWVDGTLVVDNDGLHGARERSGNDVLAAGWHSIRVEWFNATGEAELSLGVRDGKGAAVATDAADWKH